MSKTERTPMTWTVCDAVNQYRQRLDWVTTVFDNAARSGEKIALQAIGKDRKQSMQRAILAAAAPQLVEALERIVCASERYFQEHYIGPEFDPDFVSPWEQARAALHAAGKGE